jgi:hypothetical protein
MLNWWHRKLRQFWKSFCAIRGFAEWLTCWRSSRHHLLKLEQLLSIYYRSSRYPNLQVLHERQLVRISEKLNWMHAAGAQHTLAANETVRGSGLRRCLAFVFHFAFNTFETLKSFLKYFYLHASSILAFSLRQIL